jgi:hypothetical protein
MWPQAQSAAHKKLLFNRTMVTDWMGSLPGHVITFSILEAALTLIPTLVATLSPNPEALDGVLLGTANHVSRVADSLVDTMLTYGVAYDIGAAAERAPQPWHLEESCPVDAGASQSSAPAHQPSRARLVHQTSGTRHFG